MGFDLAGYHIGYLLYVGTRPHLYPVFEYDILENLPIVSGAALDKPSEEP